MEFLNIYLIGLIIAFFIIFLYNWLYSAKGHIKSTNFIDLWLSIFSWLTIILSLLVIVLEIYCHFPSYGYDYNNNPKNKRH